MEHIYRYKRRKDIADANNKHDKVLSPKDFLQPLTHTHACTHTCTHACMHTHTHTQAHTFTHHTHTATTTTTGKNRGERGKRSKLMHTEIQTNSINEKHTHMHTPPNPPPTYYICGCTPSTHTHAHTPPTTTGVGPLQEIGVSEMI